MFIQIISSLAIVIATAISLYDEKKRYKKILIVIGMIIGIAGIGISYFNKINDDDNHIKEVNDQKQSNKTLSLYLKNTQDTLNLAIASQRKAAKTNDSLMVVINAFSKSELEHFKKNEIALQDVSTQYGYRHFNQQTEELLITTFKKYKGVAIIADQGGGQEGNAFREQLSRIFLKSGWKVDDGFQTMMNKPVKGVLIGFNKKDSSSIVCANDLFMALNIANYEVDAFDDGMLKSYKSTPMEILVGPYTKRKE